MKPTLLLFLTVSTATIACAETKTADFTDSKTEVEWSLKELNPELPADWTPYNYLTMELRSSTAQRLELRLFTTNGVRRVGLLPFQGAWIRAAVPLAYFQRPDRQGFDLASLGNKSRASYWLNLMGAHWFEWIDEPNTGRGDGENYNIGFVDVTDRPYTDLVDAAKLTHARLLEVHAGKVPPVERKARGL